VRSWREQHGGEALEAEAKASGVAVWCGGGIAWDNSVRGPAGPAAREGTTRFRHGPVELAAKPLPRAALSRARSCARENVAERALLRICLSHT
jgi:hypothetical protein